MSILNTPRAGILERLGSAGKPSKATKAKRTGEGRRIEMLGQMWDRRKAANGARDRAALIVLASEYADLNCPNTAKQVMSEAEAI